MSRRSGALLLAVLLVGGVLIQPRPVAAAGGRVDLYANDASQESESTGVLTYRVETTGTSTVFVDWEVAGTVDSDGLDADIELLSESPVRVRPGDPATIRIRVNDDAVPEDNESLVVGLVSLEDTDAGSPAVLGIRRRSTVIVDDDDRRTAIRVLPAGDETVREGANRRIAVLRTADNIGRNVVVDLEVDPPSAGSLDVDSVEFDAGGSIFEQVEFTAADDSVDGGNKDASIIATIDGGFAAFTELIVLERRCRSRQLRARHRDRARTRVGSGRADRART